MIGAAATAIPILSSTRGIAKTQVHPISGDAIMFGKDEVRLDDIRAPKLADVSGAPEPFAERSRQALANIIEGKQLELLETSASDRWGRQVAYAYLTGIDGRKKSLQEIMIIKGFARVDPRSSRHDPIRRLYAAETKARGARRGLWREREYSIIDAMRADSAIGAFRLVEGKIVTSATISGRTYLNFGEDYKTDFTVTTRSVLARRWARDIVDLSMLTGARIRARGFVEKINGPSIELAHPLQIEVLELPPKDNE